MVDYKNFNFIGMIFDRYSQCPECGLFTFFGEWITPKEYFFNY
jgi:hypothetical protein